MCVYLSPLYVPTLPLYAPAYAWLVPINNYIAHPDEGPHKPFGFTGFPIFGSHPFSPTRAFLVHFIGNVSSFLQGMDIVNAVNQKDSN